MDKDSVKHVYTGSKVEAAYIIELLEESDIGAMMRDTLDDILPTGSPGDSVMVFVAEHDYEKAVQLIQESLKK